MACSSSAPWPTSGGCQGLLGHFSLWHSKASASLQGNLGHAIEDCISKGSHSSDIFRTTHYTYAILNQSFEKFYFSSNGLIKTVRWQLCVNSVEIHSSNTLLSHIRMSECLLMKIKLFERHCRLKRLVEENACLILQITAQ